MKKYEIKIKGVSPMIQNKLSRDLIKEQGQVPRSKLDDWEDNNYEKKLYTKQVDGKTVVIQPTMNIHSLLIEACKKYRISPPKDIGRTWTGYFKSSVIIEDDSVLQHDGIIKYGRMVAGQPGKKNSKVYKARPLMQNWETTLTFIDAGEYLNKKVVSEILETAGKYIGLSDYRPQFGRFIVQSVKEVAT